MNECSECMFWRSFEQSSLPDLKLGNCTRHPPRIIAGNKPDWGNVVWQYRFTMYPVTQHDQTCGECRF